jgi:hypothetical protein
MAKKDQFVLPRWAWMPLIVIALFFIVNYLVSPVLGVKKCPGSQVYCPGVGCVSGQDKCFAGSLGGASKVFSKETFVMKTCPDKTRSDGPCLLEP